MRIRFTVEDGYVRVYRSSSGVCSPEHELQFLRSLGDICVQSERNNVLLIGSGPQADLSALDLLELGRAISESGLNIAAVCNRNIVNEDAEFLQDIVWNRGGAIRFFDDEQPALEWLGIDLRRDVGEDRESNREQTRA